MSRIVPDWIVRAVQGRARGLCEYCKIADSFMFISFAIDHVIARQHHGTDSIDNLAWSCLCCNSLKGPNLSSVDPDTGNLAYLFNPRKNRWDRHFSMRDGVIMPLTAKGRATLSLLVMNEAETVALRKTYFEEIQFIP